MEECLYTAEELRYMEEAKRFFQEEVGPYIGPMDRDNEYPVGLLSKMAQKRYIGVRFPKELGGGGEDMLHETIVNEETGAQTYALACARSVPHHVAHVIYHYGQEEQRLRFLPPIFGAQVFVSECISEPDVGSDAARMKTRATRHGDHYILEGEKRFMASGGVAGLFLVFAITNPDVHPTEGMSVFAVDRESQGIAVREEFETLGWRGLRITSQILFNGVKVPKENLIGEEGKGFPILMDMLDAERIVVSAGLIGSARTCFEISARYSMHRKAFHRPLRQFEAISFRVADMATKIEAARLLRIKAARMFDKGMKITQMASMAKLFASEAAFWIASEAMQIMGGIGYTKEYPIERHFRDLRFGMIGVGSTEMMRLIIQREVYKDLEG